MEAGARTSILDRELTELVLDTDNSRFLHISVTLATF